jgi:hypothetical protein
VASWLLQDPSELIIVLDTADTECARQLEMIDDPRLRVIRFEHRGKRSKVVVDTRHALDADRWRQAGWTYLALGVPAADQSSITGGERATTLLHAQWGSPVFRQIAVAIGCAVVVTASGCDDVGPPAGAQPTQSVPTRVATPMASGPVGVVPKTTTGPALTVSGGVALPKAALTPGVVATGVTKAAVCGHLLPVQRASELRNQGRRPS